MTFTRPTFPENARWRPRSISPSGGAVGATTGVGGPGVTGLGAQRSAYTDSDGVFEVNGLAPGQYRVFVAQRNGQPDLSMVFGSLAKGNTANLYTVGEGETKELDL